MDYEKTRIVRQKTKEVLEQAKQEFGFLPHCGISFSNRMTKAAGYYKYRPNSFDKHEVSFSAPIIENNDVEAFCNDTVIHEVAHFVDRVINGSTGHNARFYNIMRRLGHPNPTRCHSFKVVSNRKEYSYRCECCGSIMKFGQVRHNKSQRGSVYRHNGCGRSGRMVYLGD